MVNYKGNTVKISCKWAANKNTPARCENDTVFNKCPVTCWPECTSTEICTNRSTFFQIKKVKANLKCQDGISKNGKPNKLFCRIKQFRSSCPVVACRKKRCPKSKNTTCKDKDGKFKITIRTQRVSCNDPVKSWSRKDDYCYNSKFRTCDPSRCQGSIRVVPQRESVISSSTMEPTITPSMPTPANPFF